MAQESIQCSRTCLVAAARCTPGEMSFDDRLGDEDFFFVESCADLFLNNLARDGDDRSVRCGPVLHRKSVSAMKCPGPGTAGGTATITLPVCVVNCPRASFSARFWKIGMKPLRGSR